MKVKEVDCKQCNKKTTFIRKSNMSNADAAISGVFTLGLGLAFRDFWWECSICKHKL